MIFRPKSLFFFFFFFEFLFSWLCGFFFACVFAHTCEKRERFKKTQKSRRWCIIFQEDFSRSRYYYTLFKRRSLSRAHNKATRARMLLYTRAPSFSLRVVLYERGAAGLTRAFFFAKDGQTDGTDEAFADSIAVTETGGTEIDRTRSRWT